MSSVVSHSSEGKGFVDFLNSAFGNWAAWSLKDWWNRRVVSATLGLQSAAMNPSLAIPAAKFIGEGGPTGTGMTPARTQAKNAHVTSRPGGYTRRARSPGRLRARR